MPVDDDCRWFEFLILEGAQAGLSWDTILRKREAYRRAFAGFDPDTVARFDEANIASLLAEPGIVRNRLKVSSAVKNARAFLVVRRSSAALTPTSGSLLTVARSGTPGEGWFGPSSRGRG